MLSKTRTAASALAIATALLAHSACAADPYEAGTVLLRARAIGVIPDERSTISAIGGAVDATNQVVPEFDITYFVTPNVGLELIAAVTKHSVVAKGTAAGTVDLGSAWLLPPTLTAQYHFDVGGMKPYVGAGINYTTFFSTNLPKTGPVTAIKYGDSIGPAVQVGVDIPTSDRWFINVDLKKVWLKTDVKVNAGAINASVHLDPWIVGAGFGYRV